MAMTICHNATTGVTRELGRNIVVVDFNGEGEMLTVRFEETLGMNL
jgi:DNA-binding protein YbaB